MNINFLVVLLITLCQCRLNVRAECCYAQEVVFVNVNKIKSCTDYTSAFKCSLWCPFLGDVQNLCVVQLCGNGFPPVDYFCGVGDCNVFGCNCDFGCIPGDPAENFTKIYGSDAFVVK